VPVKTAGRILHVNYINTGVPHAVIFVEGIKALEIVDLGRMIRYHKASGPKGANVDFVEITGNSSISIRTYERGVEDETLACGTGAVASALITGLKSSLLQRPDRRNVPTRYRFSVLTRGGETLKVYFTLQGRVFSDVRLEGKACVVYKGVWHV